MDELGAASPGTESRGCAGWLLRHLPEIPPLRGRFGWQKKWIKNSGSSISYLFDAIAQNCSVLQFKEISVRYFHLLAGVAKG